MPIEPRSLFVSTPAATAAVGRRRQASFDAEALVAIETFLQELAQLESDAALVFSGAPDAAAIEAARVEFLGAKNGRLKLVQKRMGELQPEERPAGGKRFNEVRDALQAALQSATERLASSASVQADDPTFDPTLPGVSRRLGRRHPISQTIDELVDIMARLGFSLEDGPEIEDERHNFDALNIPDDHPARDPLENFYLASRQAGDPLRLLRSQTSTVQIRVMERRRPPIRIISLGRVYRPDTADPTHYPMFHQMEGLMVDSHVTMSDLKAVLRLFANNYLGEDVAVRFRPSFFPFTEPSVEVDFFWNGRWMEFGGAGMVDPHVLQAVGYDPDEVSGFAFGLGVERLCMRRFGIVDIRDLYTNDVRFLRQF